MSPIQNSLLVVEDNLDDLFILERCFRLAGLKNVLRHVEDGQQAIDYLSGVAPFSDRDAHPMPGLVLLDLKLPIKSGFDVLSWARLQPGLKKLVIIVLTSSSDAKDVLAAYNLGANAYLVKPSSSEKLTELVQSLEAFWLKQNRFA